MRCVRGLRLELLVPRTTPAAANECRATGRPCALGRVRCQRSKRACRACISSSLCPHYSRRSERGTAPNHPYALARVRCQRSKRSRERSLDFRPTGTL